MHENSQLLYFVFGTDCFWGQIKGFFQGHINLIKVGGDVILTQLIFNCLGPEQEDV